MKTIILVVLVVAIGIFIGMQVQKSNLDKTIVGKASNVMEDVSNNLSDAGRSIRNAARDTAHDVKHDVQK